MRARTAGSALCISGAKCCRHLGSSTLISDLGGRGIGLKPDTLSPGFPSLSSHVCFLKDVLNFAFLFSRSCGSEVISRMHFHLSQTILIGRLICSPLIFSVCIVCFIPDVLLCRFI